MSEQRMADVAAHRFGVWPPHLGGWPDRPSAGAAVNTAAAPLSRPTARLVSGPVRAPRADYSTVRALIAVDNPLVRRGLADSFRRAGFARLTEVPSRERLSSALDETALDLIIMTPEMDGAFVAPLIAAMRNGHLGCHPFPIAMTLLGGAEREYVRRVIDCGPDDMVLMPVVPGQLLSRVENLINGRKPFVVTQDYTGPDRRKAPRPGTEQVPLIDVPNPLKARVSKVPEEAFQREIAKASQHLNVLKAERYAVQVSWLNEAILKMFHYHEVDPTTLQAHATRFKQIAEDLPVRMGGGLSSRVSQLIVELTRDADAIIAAGVKTSKQQLEKISATCSGLVEEVTHWLPC